MKNLKTQVMTPTMFGERFGLIPVAPHVLSYTMQVFRSRRFKLASRIEHCQRLECRNFGERAFIKSEDLAHRAALKN